MTSVTCGTRTNNVTGPTVYSNMCVSFAEALIPKSDVTDNQVQAAKTHAHQPSSQPNKKLSLSYGVVRL
jgi:hypothetical protein